MPARLYLLKTVRLTRDLGPTHLSKITGIDVERVKALENLTGIEEPWLDEAYLFARALCVDGILPLITLSGNLTDVDTGFPMASDIDVWRSGLRVPLSIACRLATLFGLDDPYELVTIARHRQIWDVVERNERGAEPGCCPWCLADIHAGAAHAATCLPDNLWGRRDLVDPKTLGHQPRPSGGTKRRAASAVAHGLKAARMAAMKTQNQLAEAIGLNSNHLARIERKELPLLLTHAEKLAITLRVTVESLYASA